MCRWWGMGSVGLRRSLRLSPFAFGSLSGGSGMRAPAHARGRRPSESSQHLINTACATPTRRDREWVLRPHAQPARPVALNPGGRQGKQRPRRG